MIKISVLINSEGHCRDGNSRRVDLGNNLSLLEILENLTDDSSGSGAVVNRADTTLPGSTVHVLQLSDAGSLTKVNLAGDGCWS